MNKLPLARNTDIVVQNVGTELLIYDLKTHKAYNLNETSAIVYQACDGKTSFGELRAKHKFTNDLIFLALDELKKENLIEEDKSLMSPFAGMSRREAVRKAALGSLIALPLISSLIAPTAAQAQSGGDTCSTFSCFCGFDAGDTTSTTCSFSFCGEGCVCRVDRAGCEVDPDLGTFFCSGDCAPGGI